MNDCYEIIGSIASPYSLKLRAILRYRRLPHVWRLRRLDMGPEIESVKPKLMPMLRFPGDTRYRVDSTPLAHALEQRHPDSRSILPPGAAERFLCHLLEDFGDEWCTQHMYYYRWIEDRTARFGAQLIIQDWLPEATGKLREQAEAQIFERQRSRLGFVCGEGNDAALETSFRELLAILEPCVGSTRYLFGSRPSLADFGIYGQLTQLVVDPLPQGIVRAQAPNVEHWVRGLDDASGIEGEWKPDLPAAAHARKALLALMARSYLPFMAANARALDAGETSFETEVCGHPYRRAPFGYQAKCYREVQARWRELEPAARDSLQPLLAETGCLPFLD
jgi:glutathione S-transferase